MPIQVHFFRREILTHKIGQADLVSDVGEGSLVGLCTQGYKSLCAAVMICANVVAQKLGFYILTPVTLSSR